MLLVLAVGTIDRGGVEGFDFDIVVELILLATRFFNQHVQYGTVIAAKRKRATVHF